MKKRWKRIPTNENDAIHLFQESDLPLPICRLLVQRGIRDVVSAHAFFNPGASKLHDPFLIKDMDKAVERLHQAIQQKEKVLLYGDYDVDGTTSVAMMYTFLNPHHKQIDYYIPDRYKEGYGVSMAGIEYAEQNGISLIIAMDCGIKAIEKVALAKTKGIDFIICDHHLPGNALPNAVAILNPKREDCNYPFDELCGCGVSFKLIQAYSQKYNLPESNINVLLDLVAIATTCDIVPMTGENRVLTAMGLTRLNEQPRPGVAALIEESGREKPLAVVDIVFGIGPMINAAGRLADARQAVQILIEEEKNVALKIASQLGLKNEHRRSLDRKMVKEASMLWEQQSKWQERKSIVLYNPDWHKGVVGIAASRLVDKYQRPAIMLTQSEGKIVGSARSVSSFNIHEAIDSCKRHLVNFGGHQHAAGLTLVPEKLDDFVREFEKVVSSTIQATQISPEIKVADFLLFEDITEEFWMYLQQLAPFGPQNRNPVFVSENVEDTGYSRLLKGNHLKLHLKQNAAASMNGIAFGQGEVFEKIQNQPFHICYNLQRNSWQGRSSIQLNVKDIKFGG